MSWEDEAPYAMIGVMTTLPIAKGQQIPKQRPIGFIWPGKDMKKKTKKPGKTKPTPYY